VISGIQDNWSGEYWINGRWVTVATTAINNNTSRINEASIDSRFLNVQTNFSAGRANGGVSNPFDWSGSTPGTITMYTYPDESTSLYSDFRFKGVVGHEFGHTLGMDDAYEVEKIGAWTRNAAPNDHVLANDIMRTVIGSTSALDIIMALKSFSIDQVQYFPGK